jgi:hypothetical protein
MSDAELYRRKADEMLTLAAQASNMADRSRFIDLAANWHLKAVQAETTPSDTPGPGETQRLPPLDPDAEPSEPPA